MEYYLVIKRNEVGIHIPTWMNLRHVGLREKSQTQTHIFYDSTYMQGTLLETEHRLMVVRT